MQVYVLVQYYQFQLTKDDLRHCCHFVVY